MGAVTYVGPIASANSEIATKAYVTALTNANLPQSTVDSMMASGFAPYVLKSYVDAQDALNATKTYIDNGDATRLHLSQRNVNNGYAGLDAQGRVPIGRINVASTQRWNKPFITPSAYNTSPISVTTTETTVYSTTVADPSFTYKLFVAGTVDTNSTVDGEYALIQVRVGNATTGQVIGIGRGLPEGYFITPNGFVDAFERTTTAATGTVNLGADWSGILVGGNSGSGAYFCDGHNAVASATDGNPAWFRARRINATDAATPADYQEQTQVFATTATSVNAFNDFYLRVNGSAFTQYVRCFVGPGFSRWYYNSGSGEAGPFNQISTTSLGTAADSIKAIAGADGTTKKFTLSRNGTVINTWNDANSALSTAGSSNRGWGIGAGNFGGGTPAAKIDSVTIGDGTKIQAAGPAVIVPSAYEAQTAKTGATTVYVTITRAGSTSTSTQTASTLSPSLYLMAVPA